jgi:hypothetical protein
LHAEAAVGVARDIEGGRYLRNTEILGFPQEKDLPESKAAKGAKIY